MRDKKVIFLTRTALLLAVTLVIQWFKMPQFITGPLVNMMLLLAVYTVNIWSGVIIGLLTPWIAFTVGILPPLLQAMIPFIMLGNAVFVLLFGLLKKWNAYVALAAASLAKFLILTISVRYIVDLPAKVTAMMQFPQLFTALFGGIIAIIIARLLFAQGFKPYNEIIEKTKK